MAGAWLLVLVTLPLSVVVAGDSEADTVGQPQVQQSSSQGGQYSSSLYLSVPSITYQTWSCRAVTPAT